MSFKAWFFEWWRSFHKFLMLGTAGRKSEAERERERERRKSAKYSARKLYKREKKRRRRSSSTIRLEKTLSAALGIIAATLSVILLPIGLISWGYKSIKRGRASRNGHNASPKNGKENVKRNDLPISRQNEGGRKATESSTKVAESGIEVARNGKKATEGGRKIPGSGTKVIESGIEVTESGRKVTESGKEICEGGEKVKKVEQNGSEPPQEHRDEEQPRSTPKSENDRYIRKRMIIASSPLCDSEAVSELEIGSYLDLTLERDAPKGNESVELSFLGKTVGLVPEDDKLPFITCITLGNKLYAVVTDIRCNGSSFEYEIETWFEH